MKSISPDSISSSASLAARHSLTRQGDAELLRAFIASRDDASFHELVRRYAGLVFSAARRRLGGDAVLAEDAAQQTFIALARNPARAARSPSLGAWLHRTVFFEAGNLLRGEFRHRSRKAAAAADATGQSFPGIAALHPGTAAAWREAQPHLDGALADLNETDRSLLVMHHLEGRPYAEIAGRLGCSAAAAQRRGHRALEKLSAQLRRRGIAVPVAVLAAGFGPGPMVSPASSAALAARALSTGGAAGTGGGVFAALLAAPVWATAAVFLTLASAFTAIRWFQTHGRMEAARVNPSSVIPGRQLPPAAAFPRRPVQPAFSVVTPDEKLTEDERAFIALARADTAAAMSWARKKFPAENPLNSFLQNGVRALADRDLPAADRLLEAGADLRRNVFQSILESRLQRDFPAAVAWADAWNLSHPNQPETPQLFYLNYNSGDWRPDIPQILSTSRSPSVRQSLLHMECGRLTAENEEGLKPLAESLTGGERRLVMEYHVSILLKRGDPDAAETLAAVQPDALYETREIAMRCPELVLDHQMSRPKAPDGGNFYQYASQVGVDWLRMDAEAAAAWCSRYSKEQFLEHNLFIIPEILKREGGMK